MDTLTEIATRCGTDKGSGHHYTGLYDILFRHRRNDPLKILEIGVQFGCSLRMWTGYFPNAQVTGIDPVSNNLTFDKDERIKFIVADGFVGETIAQLDGPYDIMCEDSLHFPETQEWFIINYSKLLAADGVMLVEDILQPETIPRLKAVLPEGFDYTAVRMSEGNSHVDSRLFILWRKN